LFRGLSLAFMGLLFLGLFVGLPLSFLGLMFLGLFLGLVFLGLVFLGPVFLGLFRGLFWGLCALDCTVLRGVFRVLRGVCPLGLLRPPGLLRPRLAGITSSCRSAWAAAAPCVACSRAQV